MIHLLLSLSIANNICQLMPLEIQYQSALKVVNKDFINNLGLSSIEKEGLWFTIELAERMGDMAYHFYEMNNCNLSEQYYHQAIERLETVGKL